MPASDLKECSSWKEVPISTIGIVVGGGTPPTKHGEYYDGDIAWITPKDLSGIHERYISRGERNITQLGYDNSSAQMLPAGTVLFSSRAPIGYIAIAKNELCTNQGFKSVVPNPEVCNSVFLYYLLTYYKKDIEAIASGTTFMEVSGAVLKNFKVRIPDLPTQEKIASILSSLDDKIEVNNQINRNLEEQAKAIFKSWFVDFEPFQNGEFINSDLGRIPKGWKVGTLGDIIELHDYKRIPLSSRQRENMEKKYPYYGAASLMDYVDNYLFDGVYLLLGEDGTVVTDDGMPVLQYVWGRFWVNNHAHILTGKNGYSAETLYVLLKNTPVKSIVTGAVQPKISQANLKSIPVVIAPQDIIRKYREVIEPLFEEIRRNSDESSRLVSIRDTLLPKLMSGEIDI